jgi:hypothetical protein
VLWPWLCSDTACALSLDRLILACVAAYG